MWRSLFLLVSSVCLGWGNGADLLYWRATTGGYDYALTTQGKIRTLCPSHAVGVRAYASYAGVRLSGLYFGSSDGDLSGGTLLPAYSAVAAASRVEAQLTFRYWHGDLRASCPLLPYLSAHASARYVGLEERHTILLLTEKRRQLLQLYGGGPGFGLSTAIGVFDGLSFSGETTVYALIAERKTDLAPTRYTREIIIIPALDLRLAFSYAWCLDDLDLSGALGYSLDYLFDAASSQLSFFESPQRTVRDTGFAGPFLQVSVLY